MFMKRRLTEDNLSDGEIDAFRSLALALGADRIVRDCDAALERGAHCFIADIRHAKRRIIDRLKMLPAAELRALSTLLSEHEL